MKQRNTQSGYSLVEVLVAITLLMLAIVGPLTIASSGLKNASRAKAQTTAFFLAQEGIEVIVKQREDNALKVYAGNGSDVWEDVELLDGTVGNELCTEAQPCSVDVENGGQLFSCADQSCAIYFNESANARYNHDVSGTLTTFVRHIVLDISSSRVHIQSTVTWGSEPDEQVELSEYIYNIYE